MLIGLIVAFSFSNFLLENFGGWWGVYGIAFGFVIIGGLFGLAAKNNTKERSYLKRDVNYWVS